MPRQRDIDLDLMPHTLERVFDSSGYFPKTPLPSDVGLERCPIFHRTVLILLVVRIALQPTIESDSIE